MSFDPAEHTIDEVHEHLASHPEDTDAVLAAEKAHGDDARSTLVASLENGSSRAAAPEGQAQIEEGGEDIDAGYPAGEYPSEGIFGYVSDEPGVQAGRES